MSATIPLSASAYAVWPSRMAARRLATLGVPQTLGNRHRAGPLSASVSTLPLSRGVLP
jgi:hypothetical protein